MKFRLLLLAFGCIALVGCDGGRRGSSTVKNPPVGCVPFTCTAAGAGCGVVPDGCGGTIDCGGCPMGESCGGAGQPNRCGPGTCNPATCSSVGATCGQVSDGCAAVLSCGDCTAPETCGGGGTPNVCGQGCSPSTCADLGAQCGVASDGCGAMINCGDCPAPTVCGGGGQPNICGMGCTPTTCAAANAACGDIPDGCGGTLMCGTCNEPLSCGGGGVANQCGAMCTRGCPTGYTCDGLGVCRGGTPTGLVLNVVTHRITGVVTMNGAPPTPSCSSAPTAYIDFVDMAQGYSLTLPVPCGPSFTFDGFVFPGTYEVRVRGNLSNLPSESYVVNPALVVQGDVTNQVFDVRTHRVTGVVTMNGALPTPSCSSAPTAYLDFVDSAQGYALTLPVPCGPAFTFDGFVFPGTYEVRVRGNLSNLPSESYVVNPALVVNAPVLDQVFDVRTHRITGVVTMNGALPTPSCSSAPTAYLDFYEASTGYRLTLPVPCGPNFTFDGFVFPGTYEVRVRGNLSDLPSEAFLVRPALAVQGDLLNQTFDVVTRRFTGVVTMNGAPPTPSCSSAPTAYVDLTEASAGYNLTIPVPCGPNFTFDGFVFPGTYEVRVRGNLSNLPSESFVVNPSLVVQNDVTNQVLNVATHRVTGVVTMNGTVPTPSCSSAPTAYVDFTETSFGYHLTIPVPCGPSFTFDGFVFPGTYEVRVRGNLSNLPSESFVVNPSLVVQADALNQIFDVVTHRVAGVVQMNGLSPTPSCSSAPTAYVDFFERANGYTHTIPTPCDGNFTFDGFVFPGVYEVRVRGNLSNLPSESYVVIDGLAIP